MKKKKSKKKKNKQIRNIIIVLMLLAITCFIMTIAPNYKRNDKTKTSFIFNNEEVTLKIENDIFIEEDSVVYLSMQDVKNILDENLYYDEEEKQIVTSSDMHVAYIKTNANTMDLNDVVISLEHSVKTNQGIIYLPISDLETVYNVKITHLQEENIVIVDCLNKEKNNANVNKNISIKFKPTIFSKTIERVKKGNSVIVIEQVEENWVKVMTDKGKIGYIKQKNLSNAYNVRQDMQIDKISLQNYNWEEVNVVELENLESIRNRKKWIEIMIENIMLDNKDGICFNLESITEYKEEYHRILIEIAPRLREIGKKTAVINNKVINTQELLQIVDVVE